MRIFQPVGVTEAPRQAGWTGGQQADSGHLSTQSLAAVVASVGLRGGAAAARGSVLTPPSPTVTPRPLLTHHIISRTGAATGHQTGVLMAWPGEVCCPAALLGEEPRGGPLFVQSVDMHTN